MDEIVFRRKESGDCPRYKNYFIHDRYDGVIDGKEMYSYALFEDGKTERKRFKTLKEADEYLNEVIGWSDWASELLHYPTKDDENLKAAIINGVVYRLWKKTNTIEIKQPDVQITPFYSKYRECLEESKKIIAFNEKQYSIFDYYVVDPEKDNLPTKKGR